MDKQDNIQIMSSDFEIPVLINNRFAVFEHNLYIRNYRAYKNIKTPVIADGIIIC